ncbi:MAG: DUF502 domain-containing protein [Mariprofundaceae bacterium]|nr:DUF502 domain-containing protein [Mariprofundaceae bacterium]
MIAALRRYLITGLVVLVPIVITILLVSWLVDMSDRLLALLPRQYQPDALFGMHVPGLGIALALLVVIIIGMLATNFIGRHLLRWFDALLARVPVVRSIYGAVKQLMEAVLGKGGKAFRQVVLVSFPQPGQWTIGFVTGPAALPIPDGDADERVAVFVPTTPNPTSGWLLFVRAADLVTLDMSVEEGMKVVVSGGMLTPEAESAPAGSESP